MRRVLREPLVHFVALGVVLFAVDAASSREEPAPDRIVVSDLVRADLAQQWESAHGERPREEKLDELVERWIDEEVLYREGLARGLGQDDPAVRSRVVSQMGFVLSEAAAVPEPTDAALRAWAEAHREELAQGTRVDFTHVFVEGSDDAARARADEMLALVRGGASPAGLGDRFSGGRRYRQREIDDLAQTFGEDFAGGVETQAIGAWEILPSRYGLHVVRVDARTERREPSFGEVRARARDAWIEERRTAIVEERIDALREAYRIEADR
jgi:hypothetical protein